MYNFKEQPPVIYFHSVGIKNKNFIRNYLTINIKEFENFLLYIKKNKLKTFFVSELSNSLYNIDNSIGITFDDGYLDNYIFAYPLLKKYEIKATIFCSIEFIDTITKNKRPTIIDIDINEIKNQNIHNGFCNLEELKEMQNSGLIDIQSHCFTHDKYPVSSKIIDLYHPGSDKIEFFLAENPYIKPFYPQKIELLKHHIGRPIFEEKSSIISPRIWINEDFIKIIKDNFKNYNWKKYDFTKIHHIIKHIQNKFSKNNEIIIKKESHQEYINRLEHEIKSSKQWLESKLRKKINVICWPYGDFNDLSVKIAINTGYEKIHYVPGKYQLSELNENFFIRIPFSSFFKTKLKIDLHKNKNHAKLIHKFYNLFNRIFLY